MTEYYYGDVEVVVRMRYRVSVDGIKKTPTKTQMLKLLTGREDSDTVEIVDEEELELMEVLSVEENCAR